jgi:phosphate transport system protein
VPRINFQQQLVALKDKLLAMAALSQQSLEFSLEAYLNSDEGLCNHVREVEAAINAAETSVDEFAYDLLAKEQPMAIDLRFILSVIKINGDLERIGDQAANIAQRANAMLNYPQISLPVDIRAMGQKVGVMIRTAIQALLEADAKLALNAIIISRNLERAADHATNIAEDVIFWVRGSDVRHQFSLAQPE